MAGRTPGERIAARSFCMNDDCLGTRLPGLAWCWTCADTPARDAEPQAVRARKTVRNRKMAEEAYRAAAKRQGLIDGLDAAERRRTKKG
jgi:hypothetical protein